MHTRAIFILEWKEGETGKQRERQRKRECKCGSVAERINNFWETILMAKGDRKDT